METRTWNPANMCDLKCVIPVVGWMSRLGCEIFEPFFSTKEQGRGLGLGLSAILGIMRSHKGGVRIESTPGRGTSVRVIFPIYAEAATDESETAEPIEGPPLRGKVLVVDDDGTVREFAVSALAQMGLQTQEAAGGESGFEVLGECEGALNAVVLDLSMPGVNGRELLGRVREKWPKLPVVLVSGVAGENILNPLDADAFATFLQKPYRPDELREALQRIAKFT